MCGNGRATARGWSATSRWPSTPGDTPLRRVRGAGRRAHMAGRWDVHAAADVDSMCAPSSLDGRRAPADVGRFLALDPFLVGKPTAHNVQVRGTMSACTAAEAAFRPEYTQHILESTRKHLAPACTP